MSVAFKQINVAKGVLYGLSEDGTVYRLSHEDGPFGASWVAVPPPR